MSEPQKNHVPSNDVIKDATAAATLYLLEHLQILTADRDRIASLLAVVIYEAIECAIMLDRTERLTPSDN